MPHAANRTMSVSEWAMLISLSMLWGGSFFFTGVALQDLPPLTFVTLRVGLAAFILNLVILLTRLRIPGDRGTWAAFAVMGFLNNIVPFTLIVWGQTHVASGLAAMLNATTPLATVVVAHVITEDEKMTGNRLLGVLLGIVGVSVMVGPTMFTRPSTDGLAQLAILGAAMSYALAAVFGRRFQRMNVPPLATAAGQVSASALLLLPFAVIVDRPWTSAVPSLTVCGAVFGIAALSTALAYVLYFRILATAGATNLLLVTFLIPVSAVLLGALILGEDLDPHHYLGMAVIGCGLAAINGRLLARARRSDAVPKAAASPEARRHRGPS